MTTAYFNAMQTMLHKGINLIEASAGTGKTYAIAMLATRFIVEADVGIDKLLLVTFTKAATEELKDRVRSRLVQAKRLSDGEVGTDDSELCDWLDALPISKDIIKQRLQTALLDIDQAGIFTIHSFCQRVLREHALESGQLFDAELTNDLAVIKQACADDFWRKQIYPRSLWQAAVLTAVYKTPDALLASIATVATHLPVYPELTDLNAALLALQQQAESAKTILPHCAELVRARFAEQKFKDSYCATFEQRYAALHNWLMGETTQLPDADALALVSYDGLLNGLNGIKFPKNKIQSGQQRKNDYVATFAIDTAPFDTLAVAIKNITLILRRSLLATLHDELDKRLLQLNALSFDHLILRLADALRSDKVEQLTTALRQHYTVALIDEFQDTDASQWFIFSSLFSAPDSHYLYLIGDPKQAIYKFRGADIYSYLDAKKQASQQFTLGKNWRSHPQLITAVNALFQRQHALLLDKLDFHAVEPAKSAADGELQWHGQARAPMVLWQLAENDENQNGYWTAGKAATAIRTAVIDEIVMLLTDDYCLQPNNRALQPKDIAILVRSNQQARDYQTALRTAGVPSVLNSTESVFTTQEATDLYILLQAIANPSDNSLLKQALTLDWFALADGAANGVALYHLVRNENALDSWMTRFTLYQQDWQKNGLLAMMRRLLAQEKVTKQLAKTELAERQLTNLYHLIELLQQAAMDEHLGMHKVLEWLHKAIAHGNAQSDAQEQQLRLESDENAVKIVTMHRSKGLEYAVVFCPYPWYCIDRTSNELVQCHEDGKMIIDLGSEQIERRRTQAIMEERAEDLRLFYVAVTRAKYRCYVAWVNSRGKEKPNESALAWLLEFADFSFAEQQATLQNLVKQAPQAFHYQLIEVVDGKISVHGEPVEPRYYRASTSIPTLQAKTRNRSLHTVWQMSSYTALSALSGQNAPELPDDKAREQPEKSAQIADALPRGVRTGNVVHELLENNSFSDLAQGVDISNQCHKLCVRYGLQLNRPEILTELLQAVMHTPLSQTDTDFCLMNIADLQYSKEMPFYLATKAMNANAINDILGNAPDYQFLTSKQLSGYLTGFIDLVCLYNGRYYVMDYKTNSLPDYSETRLTHAMREHNYGLQYWLYIVVLHRYLQNRLRGYDYEQHFGGVRYLFVRGMQPTVPLSGVYSSRPEFAKVQALAALFAL